MEKFIKILTAWNGGIDRGSQIKFANKLGIARSLVNDWLAGRRKPTEKQINDMVKLLSKDPAVKRLGVDISIVSFKEMFGIQDRGKMRVQRYAFAAETQLIPVIGVSSASNMMFILEEKKGYLTTKKEGPEDFAIEVLGHCMEDPADPRHSIYHGDTIIVRPNVPVKDGDVVVARIGEESTIKRIYFNKKDNSVDLQPDNPKFKTLHYLACEVEIVGKVIKKDEPIISKKRREKSNGAN